VSDLRQGRAVSADAEPVKSRELEVALDAARAAAELSRRYYAGSHRRDGQFDMLRQYHPRHLEPSILK